MQIIIDDKYALAADKYCWMIQEKQDRTVKGIKEDYWRPIKWYGNAKGAVHGLTELRLRTSNVSTLTEAIEYNKAVLSGIVRALSPDIEVTVK